MAIAPRKAHGVVLAVVLATLAITPARGADQPAVTVSNDGPALLFDFPGMRIGTAEYEDGPTGTTVFYFPDGVKGAVDVRGGSPGTLNATALMDAYEAKMMQAVVFSGGSWYGLSAATGVANGIKDLKAREGKHDFIAGVVGAIIYDVGPRRYSRVTPDGRLGRAALLAAEPGRFPLGARGSGRFAMQGIHYLRGEKAGRFAEWPHSGQGGAFRTIGATKVGVFTVVNALGTIVDREGRVVRCRRNRPDQQCPTIAEKLSSFAPLAHPPEPPKGGPPGNTTLTLVVTNQKLPFWALRRLAMQVHSSMNRAIHPLATEDDGDVLYAVTTDEVDNPALSAIDLSVIASELAWDAVLASVPALPPMPALLEAPPTAASLARYAGTYELPGATRLHVVVEEGLLTVMASGEGRMYFDAGTKYRLLPAQGGLFVLDSPARDVLRFEEVAGRITGLTLNPGPWPVRAPRGE